MGNFMKMAALAATTAAAAVIATPALAATPVNVNITQNADGSYSGKFDQTVAAGIGSLAFNLIFPVAGSGSLSFSSSLTVPTKNKTTGASITSATLNGTPLVISSTPLSATSTFYAGGADIDTSGKTILPLTINYNALSTAIITGNVTFGASAVPEPASWALMIGGFGIVGGFMRRRSTRTVKTTFAVA